MAKNKKLKKSKAPSTEKYLPIQEIKDDGTVVFADYTYEIMKEMLGFDCKSFTPDESEARARELMACYKVITDKYLK